MPKKRKHSAGDALLHDHCTNQLLNELRNGSLQPGQRLSELAMSKKLRVGRAAIRVAFDRLSWAGLLERVPRSGTYVRKLTLKDYTQLMEVRARLEGLAAGLACCRLSASDLDRLEKAADRLDKLGDEVDQGGNGGGESLDRDFAELRELEREFHGGLARNSGNPYIERILQHYHMLDRSFLMGMSFPADAPTSAKKVPPHREIVSALRKRVPELAERTVNKHFVLLKESLLSRFDSPEPGQNSESQAAHNGGRP
jgi:DNA-binding GntR family transcriptional regulator